MNTKQPINARLLFQTCSHIAHLVSTILLVIVGPVVCSGLAFIYKWQDNTQDATFYLALLAVLLISKDDLMSAYERSYNKYIELYPSEQAEEKK